MNNAISVIGLIGIGGLLKSLLDYYLNKNKFRSETQQQFKEVRFKAIILLAHALVHFDQEKEKLKTQRPDIKSSDELKRELVAEMINMSLYAEDQTIFRA